MRESRVISYEGIEAARAKRAERRRTKKYKARENVVGRSAL
jgi:hypothetical protein